MPRVYTRTGDDGTTGLIDGRRVSKGDPIIKAIGGVDELNSFIGLAAAEVDDGLLSTILRRIQSELFALGADLGATGIETARKMPKISSLMVSRIESEIEGIESRLPAQKSFLLPGGVRAGALLHVCRSVCRRAERDVIAVAQMNGFNKEIVKYLNRLGDFLHVAARYVNNRAGVAEQSPVYE